MPVEYIGLYSWQCGRNLKAYLGKMHIFINFNGTVSFSGYSLGWLYFLIYFFKDDLYILTSSYFPCIPDFYVNIVAPFFSCNIQVNKIQFYR